MPVAPNERDLSVLRSLARRIDPSDPGAFNNLGVLYYERGLFPEAVAAFARALELDPRMTVAQENLELVQDETGFYDRRVAELRERLRREPHDADARLELGRAYATLSQFDDAVEEFTALHEMAPRESTPLVQLGLAEQARGRQNEATAAFEEACRLDPLSSVVRVHLGQSLYNSGLHARALEVLTDAVALAPNNAQAQYLLGFTYGELGRHEEARAATKKAMVLAPALATAQANLRVEKGRPAPRREGTQDLASSARQTAGGRAHLNLGLAFRQRGYLPEALREYRLAQETGEDREAVLQGLAEVHLLRRDFAPALELYGTLLARQPGNPRLWNDQGVCLHQSGRRDEARAACAQATQLDPSYALAWNNLGAIRAGEPDDGPALAAFQAAIRARPGLLPARLNMALLHGKRRRFQQAVDGYREVLGERPEHGGAWNGIGQVLMELKQFADARNAFARSVEADPENALAHYNLGFCLSQLGQFDDALRETKRALELDPYYLPQRYVLTVDLQFEESEIPVAADLSSDIGAVTLGPEFQFDTTVLDRVFADLAPEEAPRPVPIEADPYGLARDLLDKGLLEAATGEVSDVIRRGGEVAVGTVLLGRIFARRGLHGEALERFRAALVDRPEDPDLLLGLADALLALGRGPEALETATRLVALTPGQGDALAVRARARQLTGDLDGAGADAEDASRRLPGRADLLMLVGSIAREAGDRDAARTACQAALQLDPGLVQAWYELGTVEEELGRSGEARAAYRQAVRLLPTHLEATLALAFALRREGSPDEAVNLLVDYLLAEPVALPALTLLGQSLLDARRPGEAATALTRVLHHAPDDLAALFHLGVAYARLRRYAEAVEAWDLVVDVNPSGPLAATARQHARSARDLARILDSGVEA